MELERTLILIKPDGVQRGLISEILGRFERKGLHLVSLKLMQVDEARAAQHYREHEGKPFYAGLIAYITSAPVLAAVLEGPGVIAEVRRMLGKTNPLEAAPGTIRGDLGVSTGRNLVHASDSPESAAREIGIFFGEGELLDWQHALHDWVISDN